MGGSKVPPLRRKDTGGCRLETGGTARRTLVFRLWVRHPAKGGVGERLYPLPRWKREGEYKSRPYGKIDCRLEVHLCCQPQKLSLRVMPKAWRGNLKTEQAGIQPSACPRTQIATVQRHPAQHLAVTPPRAG